MVRRELCVRLLMYQDIACCRLYCHLTNEIEFVILQGVLLYLSRVTVDRLVSQANTKYRSDVKTVVH